jgi:hypothetical protein
MKKVLILILSVAFFFPQYSWAQGCMESTSEDGVNVVGYIQPEFRYDFKGSDQLTGLNMEESSFYFNRARVGVVGNIPYDFSYYVMTELSPTLGGPFILDAFVSYNGLGPWAKISVGQFKNPFGLELTTACHQLYTINRSQVVGDLVGPFRDFGVMVSGGTDTLSFLGSTTRNFFGYSLAIMNGNGMNIQDNNRFKDIIGRVTIHPVEFLRVGVSYRFGKHPGVDATGPQDERSRIGFDAEINYKNFFVQAEYVDGSDIGSYTTGGGCGDPVELFEGSVDRKGYFVQAGYMTKWNIQPIVKFERYDPNLDTEVNGDIQNIITYGVNVFFNEWTRLQVNYLYKAEENGNVEIPNDAILVQMQVAF